MSKRFVLAIALAFLSTAPALAEQDGPTSADNPEIAIPTAPVEVDGKVLFQVRGASTYPAEKRAARISERIEAVAANPAIPADALHFEETPDSTAILAGDQLLMSVKDSDGAVEKMKRSVVAAAIRDRIHEAIIAYRAARTGPALSHALVLALAATAAFALIAGLVVWLKRRLDPVLQNRLDRHVKTLGVESFKIVRAERISDALNGLVRAVRTLTLLALSLVYLHFLLGLFPWTRPVALRLGGYVARPLRLMVDSVAAKVPDIIFLVILILVVRYVLALLRLFFDAVARHAVTLPGFEPEWAAPTYKIARLGIVALSLVVAYPYIPGSGSEAFKGVTLFLGVVFSLGSSSFISNIIAGYTMTYRRAFRVGDRVKIGDVTGDVTEVRLQVTHLKTTKNEEVIVPNSQILGSEIINFSSLAKKAGLILHTTVGIGYATPWRQVEAMLLEAADRTPGLLKQPPPFILQTALDEVCVKYELNVYTDDAHLMSRLYTALHRRILDVFNEYGVQIMTPSYEGDPEQPKVVPKERWHAAPARAGTED